MLPNIGDHRVSRQSHTKGDELVVEGIFMSDCRGPGPAQFLHCSAEPTHSRVETLFHALTAVDSYAAVFVTGRDPSERANPPSLSLDHGNVSLIHHR